MHFRRLRRNWNDGFLCRKRWKLEKRTPPSPFPTFCRTVSAWKKNCERQEENFTRLRQLIEGLPARERKLILLRYGIAGQPPLTQLETAQLLQIGKVTFPGLRPMHWSSCAKRGTLNDRVHCLSAQRHIQNHHQAEPDRKEHSADIQCSPCDISGMSSSTTTYSMAPAAKLSRYGNAAR